MTSLAKFFQDRRGTSALEFALIALALIGFVLGSFEVFSLIRVQDKLTHATKSLAKIVAQQSLVTGGSHGGLADICTGASRIMIPFPNGTLFAAIASVSTSTSNGKATTTLDWESDNACATVASAMGQQSAVAAASSFGLAPNSADNVNVVRFSYLYSSVFHFFLKSSYSIQQTGVARPRSAATITCTGC